MRKTEKEIGIKDKDAVANLLVVSDSLNRNLIEKRKRNFFLHKCISC